MTAPERFAIGCGPNGAGPVRIPAKPPTLYDDLLAVVAGRRDQPDEDVAASLVTLFTMHAIATDQSEREANKLRGQVKRVREVMAWARRRGEEIQANQDRLPTHQIAERKAWEWSAAEVRGLADRLSKALSGGNRG